MGLDFPVHTKYGSDGDLVSIWDIEVLEGFFPNKRGNIAGSGSLSALPLGSPIPGLPCWCSTLQFGKTWMCSSPATKIFLTSMWNAPRY